MIYGLIPAAGKSSRMGRPKLSLMLGERTVLTHVLDSLREGGVAQTLVVVGPQSGDADRPAVGRKLDGIQQEMRNPIADLARVH